MSDVHAEGCKLSWKKPEDNGGLPIENYVIEKLDEALGRWVPAGETDGPETNFDVHDLIPGHKYKFRVKAVNKLGKSDPLTANQSIEAKNPFGKTLTLTSYKSLNIKFNFGYYLLLLDAPSRPSNPVIKDFDADFVELGWDKPKADGGSPITGYIIEKKDKYR